MKSIFKKFNIEVYSKEEYDKAEKLGLDTSELSYEIVDEYIDIFRIESFRKTYMLDSKEEVVSLIMYSGEQIVIKITLKEFLKTVENCLIIE